MKILLFMPLTYYAINNVYAMGNVKIEGPKQIKICARKENQKYVQIKENKKPEKANLIRSSTRRMRLDTEGRGSVPSFRRSRDNIM